METIEVKCLVIGTGVIGLAIGYKLSQQLQAGEVLVIEAHPKFGQETSSRNSEVIHSGIYYPMGSKKTAWCIRGRELLYEFCEKYHVPYAKTGKYVVATSSDEVHYLEKRSSHCRELGVLFREVNPMEINEREPLIEVEDGLYFPESGIVDSHSYMATLEKMATERGALIVYRHRATRIEQKGHFWLTVVRGPDGDVQVHSPIVVNASGLGAAELSNLALQTKQYEHRFCRGRYFTLASKYQHKFNTLVYPTPPKDGLGIHITIDLDGFARVGPDVEWNLGFAYSDVERLYDCDWRSLEKPFVDSVNRYCPIVKREDLTPGIIGIRPKLFVDGMAVPDFLVENHNGFIHCLGIESPGLTSSLAIADKVSGLASELA